METTLIDQQTREAETEAIKQVIAMLAVSPATVALDARAAVRPGPGGVRRHEAGPVSV
ncbi:hypothetical protein [Streptomyces sp. NPDC050804]|uniref:hypothetical protein n=1 Tax=Streptomyces sp. NPDC050804 TaxID=3154745 RepID=UPI003427879C